MSDVSQFRQNLEVTFGPLNWNPIADGMIHLFRAAGDNPSTCNNWYWLSKDGHEGCFGGMGSGGTYTANAEKLNARLGHG